MTHNFCQQAASTLESELWVIGKFESIAWFAVLFNRM